MKKKAGTITKKFDTESGLGSGKSGSFSGLYNMYIDREGGKESLESFPGYRKICELKGMPAKLFCEGEERLNFQLSDGLYRVDLPCGGITKPKKICELREGEYVIHFGGHYLISDGEELFSLSDAGERRFILKNTAIAGCKIGALHRGRVILSGNPDLSGEVFYSDICSEDNISFDEGSRFNVSFGREEVENILSYGGCLWLFKSGDGGDGRALCYTEKDRGGYKFSGAVNCEKILAPPIISKGEILLLTSGGIAAISLSVGSGEAYLVCRYLDVNYPLPKSDDGKAKLGKWRGYIAIAKGEELLLIDERHNTENVYPLSGIVGYKGDTRIYRYSPEEKEGCIAHPKPNAPATGLIMSKKSEDGRMIFYSLEGEKRYAVYPTEERGGGQRLAPENYAFTDGNMLFYTSDGSVYLFSRDSCRARHAFDTAESADADATPLTHSFADHRVICRAEGALPDLSSLGGQRERAECTLHMEIQADCETELSVTFISGGKVIKETAPKIPPSDSGAGESKYLTATARLPCRKSAELRLEARTYGAPFSLKRLYFEANKT